MTDVLVQACSLLWQSCLSLLTYW